MEKMKNRKWNTIFLRALAFLLSLAFFMAPISTGSSRCNGMVMKVQAASTYDSWIEDTWGTGDTYSGINSLTDLTTDIDEGDSNWLTDSISFLIGRIVRELVAMPMLWLSDKIGTTPEKIILGRVATGTSQTEFQFNLGDGNVYGVTGSIIYAILRNMIFLLFAIQLIWMMIVFVINGTGRNRSDLKSGLYNFVFMFALLYAVPIMIDIVIFIRDTIIKGLQQMTSALTGHSNRGITDTVMTLADGEWTIATTVVLVCCCCCGFFFAFDYIKTALKQVFLFGVFPVVAWRSFSDKQIFNKWVAHMIPTLFIPLIDFLGIWLVLYIQSLTVNGSTDGAVVVSLFAYISIIPARNMILQLFGAPPPARGFSLMAAAMMLARTVSRPKEGDKNTNRTNNKDSKSADVPIQSTNTERSMPAIGSDGKSTYSNEDGGIREPGGDFYAGGTTSQNDNLELTPSGTTGGNRDGIDYEPETQGYDVPTAASDDGSYDTSQYDYSSGYQTPLTTDTGEGVEMPVADMDASEDISRMDGVGETLHNDQPEEVPELMKDDFLRNEPYENESPGSDTDRIEKGDDVVSQTVDDSIDEVESGKFLSSNEESHQKEMGEQDSILAKESGGGTDIEPATGDITVGDTPLKADGGSMNETGSFTSPLPSGTLKMSENESAVSANLSADTKGTVTNVPITTSATKGAPLSEQDMKKKTYDLQKEDIVKTKAAVSAPVVMREPSYMGSSNAAGMPSVRQAVYKDQLEAANRQLTRRRNANESFVQNVREGLGNATEQVRSADVGQVAKSTLTTAAKFAAGTAMAATMATSGDMNQVVAGAALGTGVGGVVADKGTDAVAASAKVARSAVMNVEHKVASTHTAQAVSENAKVMMDTMKQSTPVQQVAETAKKVDQGLYHKGIGGAGLGFGAVDKIEQHAQELQSKIENTSKEAVSNRSNTPESKILATEHSEGGRQQMELDARKQMADAEDFLRGDNKK